MGVERSLEFQEENKNIKGIYLLTFSPGIEPRASFMLGSCQLNHVNSTICDIFLLEKEKEGAGEMAQYLGHLAALPKGLSLVPSTHTR